jgi:2,3-bisphosphoglycerate-independent phosphoglycerate mutase
MLKPVVLVILDGWGIAEPGPGNAISRAQTPTMTSLWSSFPHTALAASGEAVGLPHGEDGNTETGHLNLGAGQIVFQDLPRINMAIADGSFLTNPAFLNAIRHVKTNKSALHLLGLVGAGGVHSAIEHLFALMRLSKVHEPLPLFLHLITDGRDSPPTSALTYVAEVKRHTMDIGIGEIASIMGRYFAMDRDQRWDRTAASYFALTRGGGKTARTPEDAITQSYTAQKTDEFIEPTLIVNEDGIPKTLIRENDAVIFFNFRIDRPRQLTKAFVLPDFERDAYKEDFDPYAIKYFKRHIAERKEQASVFDRGERVKNVYFVTMTQYEANLPVDVAFPPQFIQMPLGRIISDHGLRQIRIAETEKERFVTYYFNGQREEPFPGEDRVILPSPAVSTYDVKPEMATPDLAHLVCDKVKTGSYDVVVANIACPDMVAHTGNIDATIAACEAADRFLAVVWPVIRDAGGAMIVTSDHGNAEELINTVTHDIDTEHSDAPVPFIVAAREFEGNPTELGSGILADVAPTVLELLGIPKPSTMTGRSLVHLLS